jgi:methylisocitrate lyase
MYGVGDYGMLTISELIEFATRIAGEIDIPVIADADDGGGNPLNVYRAVQRYEHGGVGGIMIEDMYGAKHIPGMREGLMASKEAFVDKIKAALDARRSQDFVILARTDALSAKESTQVMEDRLMAYAAAGVDMLFVPAMPIKEIPRLTAATKKPFMGITTQVPLADQEKAQIVLGSISVPLVSLAAGAVHKALGELKATGVIQELQQRSLPSDIMQKIVGAAQNAERAKKYNVFRS